MIYNKEQEEVINAGVYHVLYGDEQVFQYSGAPGTGKTAVLFEMIKRIGIPLNKIAPMAYIGQAAIVMRTRGLINAKTIHSWIYDRVEIPVYDENGKPVMDPVYNVPKVEVHLIPKDLSHIEYFIIDEGSTVPYYMKKDIEAYGKKIIVCGDINQLPPVADKPAYLYSGKVMFLRQIMRQAEGSFIIQLSQLVLRGIEPSAGLYGNVLVIEQKDLTDEMIRYADIMICGKNKTREYYNNYTRQNIFGYRTRLPQCGEKVICRKNNWNIEVDGISLANGLAGRVINDLSIEQFDGKTFSIDFKPDLLSSHFNNIKCDYKYFISDNETRKLLKNSKYATGEKFEFAYAITTHLSQGGQWNNGIYISEYLSRDIQANLNYVGVSRFVNSLIYVIPDRKPYYSGWNGNY